MGQPRRRHTSRVAVTSSLSPPHSTVVPDFFRRRRGFSPAAGPPWVGDAVESFPSPAVPTNFDALAFSHSSPLALRFSQKISPACSANSGFSRDFSGHLQTRFDEHRQQFLRALMELLRDMPHLNGQGRRARAGGAAGAGARLRDGPPAGGPAGGGADRGGRRGRPGLRKGPAGKEPPPRKHQRGAGAAENHGRSQRQGSRAHPLVRGDFGRSPPGLNNRRGAWSPS